MLWFKTPQKGLFQRRAVCLWLLTSLRATMEEEVLHSYRPFPVRERIYKAHRGQAFMEMGMQYRQFSNVRTWANSGRAT